MTTQQERIERMKKAGIPLPITQLPINEGAMNAVPVTAQNADKHARLQALKSGANRQQVQSLVKAKTVQNSFEGIPEASQKRRPNNPANQMSQVTPSAKVPVRDFAGSAPVSSEFSAMEAMYGGGNSSSAINMNMPQMNQAQPQMNTTQPELSIQEDGYGPSFDPARMLAEKRASMQQSNQYLQHAVAPEQQQQVMAPGQQQFDINNMQRMMEEIAKNTISEVLNSYTEKNKDKLTYENVNVKTGDGTKVIKTQDGKYYKLVPVKLKNS
jgi:hypothetical protein